MYILYIFCLLDTIIKCSKLDSNQIKGIPLMKSAEGLWDMFTLSYMYLYFCVLYFRIVGHVHTLLHVLVFLCFIFQDCGTCSHSPTCTCISVFYISGLLHGLGWYFTHRQLTGLHTGRSQNSDG